ncbi:MAG: hypothetical protein ACTHJT_14225 [Cytophaga sp.]|uniref:hypothetical protein n=1 Tax=Cytophaga sp. TaxID=29535 RepID=UPI003F7CF971
MGLTIPVILSSVNNLSDARYAAGMGVDMMGFEVEPGAERYVSPELFKAIVSWVAGIQTVVEVTILTPELLACIQENYQPDFIQYEKLAGITPDTIPFTTIQKVSFENNTNKLDTIGNQINTESKYVLFELSHWAEWRSNQDKIKQINSQFPAFWSLPIEKNDIPAINELALKGIALKGGDEQRPGWKDLDQLIDILEALEEN